VSRSRRGLARAPWSRAGASNQTSCRNLLLASKMTGGVGKGHGQWAAGKKADLVRVTRAARCRPGPLFETAVAPATFLFSARTPCWVPLQSDGRSCQLQVPGQTVTETPVRGCSGIPLLLLSPPARVPCTNFVDSLSTVKLGLTPTRPKLPHGKGCLVFFSAAALACTLTLTNYSALDDREITPGVGTAKREVFR
jgi:hypothetical protein